MSDENGNERMKKKLNIMWSDNHHRDPKFTPFFLGYIKKDKVSLFYLAFPPILLCISNPYKVKENFLCVVTFQEKEVKK